MQDNIDRDDDGPLSTDSSYSLREEADRVVTQLNRRGFKTGTLMTKWSSGP